MARDGEANVPEREAQPFRWQIFYEVDGMKLDSEILENGIRIVKLTGKLDNEGTRSIEREFIQLCSGEQPYVLVDLSRLTYLSSIGIPLLVNSAKAVTGRGGRLALVAPQTNVKAVLEMTGVTHMIRMYKDMTTARERLIQAS